MFSDLDDTHPEIKELRISLLRNASTEQKINQLRSLSQTVVRLSKRAIARANPHYSKREIDLAFIALHYGDELAHRLDAFLIQENT